MSEAARSLEDLPPPVAPTRPGPDMGAGAGSGMGIEEGDAPSEAQGNGGSRDGWVLSDDDPSDALASHQFAEEDLRIASQMFEGGAATWGTRCTARTTIRVYRPGALHAFAPECTSRSCVEHGFNRRLLELEGFLHRWRIAGRPDLAIHRITSARWESFARCLNRAGITATHRTAITTPTGRVVIAPASGPLGPNWPDPQPVPARDVPSVLLRLLASFPILRIDPSGAEARRREYRGASARLPGGVTDAEHEAVWRLLRAEIPGDDWPAHSPAPMIEPTQLLAGYSSSLDRIRADGWHLR